MNDAVNILLVSNKRYFPGLAATMTSMLRSASHPDWLQFYVYHDDLAKEDRKALDALHHRHGGQLPIIYRNPDLAAIETLGPKWNGSYLPWVRLFVCTELDIDWIIYADVDTLWFKDVCVLWKQRKDEVPIFACADMRYIQKDTSRYHVQWNADFIVEKYFCSGMVMMNLASMRRFNLPRQVAKFIDEHGCPYYPDQDILNYFYNKDCVILDQTWNCMNPTRGALNGSVLHCLGIGRMFNGPMIGWSGTSAIWYRFHNKFVNPEHPLKGCGLIKSIWYHLFGLFYPCEKLYRLLTIPFASHRAEQLTNMQFHAWLYTHSKFGK